MRSKKQSVGLTAVLASFIAAMLVSAAPAVAQQETTLRSFNKTDGYAPLSGLILDSEGNLYGTTPEGGIVFNGGTVFELSPKTGGGWMEKVLHTFIPDAQGTDGVLPFGALLLDGGNLYGVTAAGGTHNGGTVFELTPTTGGKWVEKILHNFSNVGRDGFNPSGGVIADANGSLYGTTCSGGAYNMGSVFQLAPQSNGSWTETVLHSFGPGYGPDGVCSIAGLVFDASGNLYGTTNFGGAYRGPNGVGLGTVFELTPTPNGSWTEQVLHSFNYDRGSDGVYPVASLIFDSAGNLYSTTSYGGKYDLGTVFQLTPTVGGAWRETVLHSFGYGTDGWQVFGGLALGASGNLFGTTYGGGTGAVFGAGIIFELSPSGAGSWTEEVLYNFGNSVTDGQYPNAGLVLDSGGRLYGSTEWGGASGYGTIFKVTP
jgi:uncharacterized repeat protein (TIGR03803 family)